MSTHVRPFLLHYALLAGIFLAGFWCVCIVSLFACYPLDDKLHWQELLHCALKLLEQYKKELNVEKHAGIV